MSTPNCVSADIVSANRGAYVSINKVRWPIYGWEVANKDYVDAKAGSAYTYISPMHKDDITLRIYIDEAGSGAAGVVSTGSQYFTGDKTFVNIYVDNTIPASANSVITQAYLSTHAAVPVPIYSPQSHINVIRIAIRFEAKVSVKMIFA